MVFIETLSLKSGFFQLPKRPDLFVKGRAKNTLLGTKALTSRWLGIRIDFANGGCLSTMGSALRANFRRLAQAFLTRYCSVPCTKDGRWKSVSAMLRIF